MGVARTTCCPGRAQRAGGHLKISLNHGRKGCGLPPVAFGHPDNKLSGPPESIRRRGNFDFEHVVNG